VILQQLNKHFHISSFSGKKITPVLKPLVVLAFLSFTLFGCKTQESVTEDDSKGRNEQAFRTHFHDAIAEKMIGHYDRAIELFEHCLTLNQTSHATYFALSELYEITGNQAKAIQSAESAYRLDATNKWYALRLGDLFFSIGDYQNSAKYFDAGIDETEKNIELKFKYAESLIYSNQYQKAILVMDQIEVETGKLPELSLTKHDMYLALGEEEKAEQELTTLIADNPSNVENRIVVADYFLKTNQLDKAKLFAEETIKLNPENGTAYIIIADVELRKGNLDAAFENLKKGFVKDDVTIERKLELIWGLAPYAFEGATDEAKKIEAGVESLFILIYDVELKNEKLHRYYGTFLKNQGNNSEALAHFKMAFTLKSSDFSTMEQLLNIEYEMHAYSDMYFDGEKAIELYPSQPMFYLLTGIGAYESGKFDEAEEYLFLGKDLVVQDNELLAEFYYHLGKVLCLQKKYTEGYVHFEKSKDLFPAGAKVYGSKAKFLLEEKKTSEAEIEIKIGLSIDANNAVVLYGQGLIYFSKKEYSSAIKSLEKGLMNDVNNGWILEAYGDALYLNGEKDKAVVNWIEAEKKGNKSTLLKRKIADKMYYEN